MSIGDERRRDLQFSTRQTKAKELLPKPSDEDLLREGEEIEITKRKRAIARLVPFKPEIRSRRPDLLAHLRKIYGGKPLKVSEAELISRERGRY